MRTGHGTDHDRRRALRLAGVAFTAGLMRLPSPPAAHGQTQPPVIDPARLPGALVPQKVTNRVWYVEGSSGIAIAGNQGFNSNAGFVVTPDGVVVVDALGTVPLGRALVAAIRRGTRAPIRRVVITHYHPDHFYGLAPLKAAGADVWAHRRGRDYLESPAATARLEQRRRQLAPFVDAQTTLVPADRWLEGDASFTLGGMRFELIHVGPAHAPDDVIVVVPDEQVVFCGDLVVQARIPFTAEADTRGWLAALDRLTAMGPRLMVPGHGPASKDPLRDIAFTRGYLRHLRDAMGRAVKDRVPFADAYARTDWRRFASLPAFEAANRLNAHAAYVELEREAGK